MRLLRTVVLLIASTTVFSFYLYFHTLKSNQSVKYFYTSKDSTIPARNQLKNEPKQKTKVILLYSTLFGNPVWHGLEGSRLYTHLEKYNCLITYNKTTIKTADAVVFHGRDVEHNRYGIYSAKKLLAAKRNAPLEQKWIFLSHENPQMDSSIYAPYNGLFNWTSTFRRQSDIFIPYASYIKLEKPVEVMKNYAEGKTGLVVWAVSNCNLMRQEYAIQLEKFISITVFGRCARFFKSRGDCTLNNAACIKIFSSYKFYLAFENNFCDDYVTEKYWLRIMQDTIPVVMGASYDKGLVIPGSFIDASNFASIKALADYLKYLDSNDTAYNEYFKWKSTYKVNPNEDLHVRICQALHSHKFNNKSEVMLSEEFSYKKTCESFQWKIEKLWKQINAARGT